MTKLSTLETSKHRIRIFSVPRDLPRFLIYTASREGMSGAPVFFRSQSYMIENSQLVVGQTAQIFYGIYSGRMRGEGRDIDDQIAAQVGVVWKPQAVFETVANGVSPVI